MKNIALILLALFSLSFGISSFAQSYNLGTLRGYSTQKKTDLKTLRGQNLKKIHKLTGSGTGISGDN